jgi:citrate synthase
VLEDAPYDTGNDQFDISDPRHRELSAFRLIAKTPTMTAMCYTKKATSGDRSCILRTR